MHECVHNLLTERSVSDVFANEKGGMSNINFSKINQIILETSANSAYTARMLRRWDESAGGWQALPLDGQLLLARGLGDVRARLDLG